MTSRDKHCAKNSQDRRASDIQTIKELAVPGTSIQWAYISWGGFIESLQQLDLDPTDAREYFVKEQNKRWTIAACRAALDLRPNYAEAWNNICAGYNKLGRYEEAAAACEQALRYKSDFELAHNNLQYARKMEKAPVR